MDKATALQTFLEQDISRIQKKFRQGLLEYVNENKSSIKAEPLYEKGLWPDWMYERYVDYCRQVEIAAKRYMGYIEKPERQRIELSGIYTCQKVMKGLSKSTDLKIVRTGEYFRVWQDKELRNQIKPLEMQNRKWESGTPVFIRGHVENPEKYIYFSPIIEDRILLISDAVKRIWEDYQTGWNYYPCALGIVEQRKVQVYWIVETDTADVFSDSTEYYKDGTLKNMILSEKKIEKQKLFSVCVQKKRYLIIEKDILERMLQEHICGFRFEKIMVERAEERNGQEVCIGDSKDRM